MLHVDAPALVLMVPGKPRPQGSLTLARDPRTGGEFARYSLTTVDHRNLVVAQLLAAWEGRDRITGPVAVRCTFRFVRPASHFGTGRNAGVLKESAPRWMTSMPDNDKLCRLVNDALTVAGVLADDKLVVIMRGEKIWADRSETLVEVWEL